MAQVRNQEGPIRLIGGSAGATRDMGTIKEKDHNLTEKSVDDFSF